MKLIRPTEKMSLIENTTLLPGVYNFFEKDGLVIENVKDLVLDGSNSVIIGGKMINLSSNDSTKDEFSYGYGNMKDEGLPFNSVGLTIKNCTNVTIKNFSAKGFEIGLLMENCEYCTIIDCDFSYNYNNPDWGWEEHLDLGGIVLKNCNNNVITKNKATDVFSALVLNNSNNNKVISNNFSHTSNVGLRLWLSSYNEFENNDFSWGIRKHPYEIHARDSSSVLIESASNHNKFYKNDMRYGGDGLFIRSLNNMMSLHNVFIENDMSYANNNAIESWDAYNTYIGNIVSYSSYGFWLGNSDHTVLKDNIVEYNGHVFKNAPESFGNAGIAVVNGSGTDFIVENNKIRHNSGPGIAIRNKKHFTSKNWIIKDNIIDSNTNDVRGYSGYGIFMEHCSNMRLINNKFINNDAEDIYYGDNVYNINVVENEVSYEADFVNILASSKTFVCGHEYEFYLQEEFDDITFSINEIDIFKNSIKYTFYNCGKYEISVEAKKGNEVYLGHINIYVLPNVSTVKILAIDSNCIAEENRIDYLSENSSIMFTSKNSKTNYIDLLVNTNLENNNNIKIFCKYFNDFIDWDRVVLSPVVTLFDSNNNTLTVSSLKPLFSEINSKYNESKYEWIELNIPLKNDINFEVLDKLKGDEIVKIRLEFSTPIESYFKFQLGSLQFTSEEQQSAYRDILSLKKDDVISDKVIIECSNKSEKFMAIFNNQSYCADKLEGWEINEDYAKLTLNLPHKIYFDNFELNFYYDLEKYFLPDNVKISVGNHKIDHKVVSSQNNIKFEEQFTDIVIIEVFSAKPVFVYNISSFKTSFNAPELNNYKYENVNVDDFVIKLNLESNLDETSKDLIYDVVEFKDSILSSKSIKRGIVKSENIKFKEEISLPVELEFVENKKYLLKLSISNIAKSMSEGKYFRWVGFGMAPMNKTYGYINGETIINSGRTGWGSNYLKLNTTEGIISFCGENETLGNRFGLTDMEELYQEFVIPNKFQIMTQMNILTGNNFELKGEFEFIVKETNCYRFTFSDSTANILHNGKQLTIENNTLKINLSKGDILSNQSSNSKLILLEVE